MNLELESDEIGQDRSAACLGFNRYDSLTGDRADNGETVESREMLIQQRETLRPVVQRETKPVL